MIGYWDLAVGTEVIINHNCLRRGWRGKRGIVVEEPEFQDSGWKVAILCDDNKVRHVFTESCTIISKLN